MWGFESVMLALLFLLMPNTASYHTASRNSVDLAVSYNAISMPGALREDAMCINIQSDGTIYFGYHRIWRAELPDLIREGLRNGTEKKVYISADARGRYGRVIEVLDEVRLAGVEKVGFRTWQHL